MFRWKHLDKDDCKSTYKLLTGPFKDDVIFYQSLEKDQDSVALAVHKLLLTLKRKVHTKCLVTTS